MQKPMVQLMVQLGGQEDTYSKLALFMDLLQVVLTKYSQRKSKEISKTKKKFKYKYLHAHSAAQLISVPCYCQLCLNCGAKIF
jgi:hypothetical protein